MLKMLFTCWYVIMHYLMEFTFLFEQYIFFCSLSNPIVVLNEQVFTLTSNLINLLQKKCWNCLFIRNSEFFCHFNLLPLNVSHTLLLYSINKHHLKVISPKNCWLRYAFTLRQVFYLPVVPLYGHLAFICNINTV